MNPPYDQLARLYDSLMADVDYAAWVKYLAGLIARYGAPGRRLLDLGCGTGNITLRLVRSGYDVIGADLSEEMLAVAADKGLAAGLSPARWRHQDMRRLNFPAGSFDIVNCACDGINYLRDHRELRQTLTAVRRCLQPRGLLLFDVHSEHKMRDVLAGGQFVQESADGYCIWTSEFDPHSGDCRHEMTLFLPQGSDLYRRCDEIHRQHYFSPDAIANSLADCGFEVLAILAWGSLAAPSASDERIQVAARCLDS